MPPKIKITREDIVRIAVEIVREQGDEMLNARTLAERLSCSTQPIFSNFRTMQELRFAVIGKSYAVYQDYMRREMESGAYPRYKASGMAYIRFAAEEKELFKLLFMRDRTEETVSENEEELELVIAMVQQGTGLPPEEARLFHLEMWVGVHGIAVLIATNYLALDWELISRMLSDSYFGLKKRFLEKE